MKMMGVDYGDARTGIAISDYSGTIVGETAVITHWNREEVIRQASEIARAKNISRIIVGLPKNMNGTEGERARLCREFANLLAEASGIETILWDERNTTVDAHRILSENNVKGKKRKQTVDAVAASLILEGYLMFASIHNNSEDQKGDRSE